MNALWLLIAVTIPAQQNPAAEEQLTAGEILQKSDAAYAAVKTYVGTTTARGKTDFGAMLLETVSSAKVTFLRPGKIRIEGTTASNAALGKRGHPFAIVSDGQTTWKSFAIMNNGAFSEVKNIAQAGMAGVAQGAAEGIPAALMKSDGAWTGGHDPYTVARVSPPKLAGRDKIETADCYKLVAKHASLGDITWWIDSRSFLLRQMTREYNASQIAQQAKAVEEAVKRMGRQPPPNAPTVKSKSDRFSFTIDQVDGPVDERLFQKPTMKLISEN